MEKLEQKVNAFIALNYKKWNDIGMFSHGCENIHQFEKWWYLEFLFTLPDQKQYDNKDESEYVDNHFGIENLYSYHEFFEGNVELFEECVKFVHNYYDENDGLYSQYFNGETYTRTRKPLDIMNSYASIYAGSNHEIMKIYLPSHLK
jgi:hypothetical protein